MRPLTAREEFELVKALDREADLACERYDTVRDSVGIKTASLDNPLVTGGGVRRDITDVMPQLEKLKKRVEYAMDAYGDQKLRCLGFISRLSKQEYKEVLERRYIWCANATQVSVKMGKSYAHIMRMTKEAFEEIDKMIEHDRRCNNMQQHARRKR